LVELPARIVGKLGVGGVANDLAKVVGHGLPVRRAQLGVLVHAEAGLVGVDAVLERVALHAEHDRAEALYEAPVGVAAEARVAGESRQTLKGLGVESEVQHGVHHSGHRHASARSHRYQERIRWVAEALAGLHFDFVQRAIDLLLHAGRKLAAVFVVGETRLGCDREARRHGDTGTGHLGGTGALAAKQIAHGLSALAEQVDPLVLSGGHAAAAPTSGERAPQGRGARGSRM